jgi:excisionase family DNA binding protein
MDDQRLLTIDDLAALTGFSVGTLYHWVSQKRIPVVRFSARCVRFRRSDIEAWIAQMVVERDQDGLAPIGRSKNPPRR